MDVAVIMAAGASKRMGPRYTGSKCTASIEGEAAIVRLAWQFANQGIKPIFVVPQQMPAGLHEAIGRHGFAAVASQAHGTAEAVRAAYPLWRETNVLYVTAGDQWISDKLMEQLIHEKPNRAVVFNAIDLHCGARAVLSADKRCVQRIVEESAYSVMSMHVPVSKPLYKFSAAQVVDALPYCRRDFPAVVAVLARRGVDTVPMYTRRTELATWNTVEELQRARRMISDRSTCEVM